MEKLYSLSATEGRTEVKKCKADFTLKLLAAIDFSVVEKSAVFTGNAAFYQRFRSLDFAPMPSFIPLNSLCAGREKEEAQSKIGESGMQKLIHLLEKVYVKPGEPGSDLNSEEGWKWAYAPSLVVRGEMEVFGQSHPRFAIRLKPFAGKKEGFLNLRRVKETCSQLPPQWTPISPEDAKAIEFLGFDSAGPLPKNAVTPLEAYKDSSSVADCLLPTPSRLEDHYFVLKSPAELALAFGEGLEGGLLDERGATGERMLPGYADASGFQGSPYMRQIQMLGAGVCAQAVCFMASALLARHARYLHGLAEITTRARNIRSDPHTILYGVEQWHLTGGLNPGEIMAYFRSNGLKTHLPGVPSALPLPRPRLKELAKKWNVRKETVQAAAALRRYLLAGVPVILNVDSNRLRRHSPEDVKRLGLPEIPVHDSAPDDVSSVAVSRRHAVLAVGAAHGDPGSFLIHDPAMYPFVKLSVEQWDRVCPYDDEGSGGRHPAADRPPVLEPVSLLPVLPHDQIEWWLTFDATESTGQEELREKENQLSELDSKNGKSPEYRRHFEEREAVVTGNRRKSRNLLEVLSDLHQSVVEGAAWRDGAIGAGGNFFSVQDHNPQRFYPPGTDVLHPKFKLLLAAADDLVSRLSQLAHESGLPAERNPMLEAAKCLEKVPARAGRAAQWYWISCLPVEDGPDGEARQQGGLHQLYIWDACAAGEENLLLLFGQGNANHWDFFKSLSPFSLTNLAAGFLHLDLHRLTPATEASRQAPPRTLPQKRSSGATVENPPELALISSCVVVSHRQEDSLGAVLEKAREAGVNCADVYCFMHQEAQRIFDVHDGRTAIDIMAEAFDKGEIGQERLESEREWGSQPNQWETLEPEGHPLLENDPSPWDRDPGAENRQNWSEPNLWEGPLEPQESPQPEKGQPAVRNIPAIHVKSLANPGTDVRRPEELAEKLARQHKSLPIRAFSTYLPEVCATAAAGTEHTLPGRRRDRAAKAIAFLLLTAERLNTLAAASPCGAPHKVKVLELVCGTRLRQVRPVKDPARDPDGFRFVASEWGTEQALRSMLQTLQEARTMVGTRGVQDNAASVTYALELEPGDFYTLNGSSTARRLLHLLDSDEFRDLRPCTGLNLDIPHWGFLCDEGAAVMATFAREKDILQRIVHVHLSDHYRGHFCDLPAGYFRAWDDPAWQPWRDLLPLLMSKEQTRIRTDADLPLFSGVVSCELEGARSMSQVQRAIRAASLLTGRSC